MLCIRFLNIWCYFYLVDNFVVFLVGDFGYDKFYRVREFLNIIFCNISREYKFLRDIVIDEIMVFYKGRLLFK